MTTLEQIEKVYSSLKKVNDLIQVSEKRHADEKISIIQGFAEQALKEAERLSECQQIIAAIETVFTPVSEQAVVTHASCAAIPPVVSGKVYVEKPLAEKPFVEKPFSAGLGKW